MFIMLKAVKLNGVNMYKYLHDGYLALFQSVMLVLFTNRDPSKNSNKLSKRKAMCHWKDKS